jgi:hypothetical protein
MTGWGNILDGFLKSPGYIIAGVFIFSLFTFMLFPGSVSSWPESWIATDIVRLGFLLLATLSGSLLLAKFVNFVWRHASPLGAREWKVRKWRKVVAQLPEAARAVLRILADGGRDEFHGEPRSDYVKSLRDAGLIRVSYADRQERWGRYALEGAWITSGAYPRFADLMEIPGQKLASIQASLTHALSKSGGGRI